MPKVVFFGNERLASGYQTKAPTLQALIEHDYEVCAVISNFERARSRKARELEIATIAGAHGIPLLTPDKPAEIIEQLRDYQADIGVLVAYGRIVPQSIIDIFPRGIVNIHPSLLPLHRGSIPVESVILEGSADTGVSLMQLVKAMDAGPVYRQQRVALLGNETKTELTTLLLGIGRDLLIESLPSILDGSLKPSPQDDNLATYDKLLASQDGILDFFKPAVQLEREIRAYADWPKSRTVLAGKDVIVTKAHVVPGNADGSKPGDVMAMSDVGAIIIETSDGQLSVELLKPAGKPEMSAQAFLAGNKL